MKRLLFAVTLLAAALALAPAAHADSWTISLLPPSGAISGAPGSTIGWGYTITNLSATSWLEIFSLAADPFLNGTPDGNIFSFPILQPNQSLTFTFIANAQGLYQLTWDLGAPDGFTNSGTFLVSGTFYDGDPFGGGNPLSNLDQTVSYIATVTAPPVSVPEPGTLLLAASGILGLFLRRRAPASA